MAIDRDDWRTEQDAELASSLEASALHHIGSYWLASEDGEPAVYKRMGARGRWAWERHDGFESLSGTERERRAAYMLREAWREYTMARAELEGRA